MTCDVCRLCGLQKPNTRPIFIETSKGLPVNELQSFLPDLISSYLYLKIATNDDLPKTICIDCYHKLKRWNNFAKLCKKTQKNLMGQNPPICPTTLEMSSQNQEKEDCVADASLVNECSETITNTIEEVVNSMQAEDDVLKEITIDIEKKEVAAVYSCNYCEKTYSNKRTHQRHVSIMHENPQEFHCEHCSKTFYLKPALKCHLETHAPGRDFCCHVCGATFRTGSALRCHLRLHRHDYAAFKCVECGKCFKLPHQLERHRRTHSALNYGDGSWTDAGGDPESQGVPDAAIAELLQSCLEPRGQYASPSACNKFINCWDDYAVEQQCPGGLVFSEEGFCDYPENVDCGSRESGKPGISGEGECPTPYGHYRSTESCGLFYVCVGGSPVKFECPEGLNYNTELGVCDYPNRVDCGGTPSDRPPPQAPAPGEENWVEQPAPVDETSLPEAPEEVVPESSEEPRDPNSPDPAKKFFKLKRVPAKSAARPPAVRRAPYGAPLRHPSLHFNAQHVNY